jgi:hypothetical protein
MLSSCKSASPPRLVTSVRACRRADVVTRGIIAARSERLAFGESGGSVGPGSWGVLVFLRAPCCARILRR